MEKRFERNIPTISETEQELLRTKSIAIIGCGGLGGNLVEMTARLGLREITVCDGDVFDETNLNRQLLSSPSKIGFQKAETAKDRILEINPETEVCVFAEMFTEKNAEKILEGADLALDALDNVKSRLLLEKTCEKLNIPLVHGAVSAWSLQVAVVAPGSKCLSKIYPSENTSTSKSNIPSTISVCAGIQVSEAIKILTKKESALLNKLLAMNLDDFSTVIIDI